MRAALSVYIDFFKNISKNVKLYFGIIFFATIVSSAYNMLFGIYLKNLGFDEAFVGSILSINTLGVAIGAVPVALLADRLNRKHTLILGLFIMAMTNLIVLNVHIPIVMQIFSFIFGIGNSTIMILQAPIIYDSTPDEHRVTAFSMAFVLQNAAFVIGSFILGHVSQWLTAQSTMVFANQVVLNFATSLLFIGVIIALAFEDEKTPRDINNLNGEESPSIKDNFSQLLKGYKRLLSGKIAYYLIQVSLIGFGAGMIVPFFSMYLKYSLQTSDGVVGTIMSISQFGTVLGGLIVPPLAKKLGRVNTVMLCQLLSIPFLISISFPQGIIIITISFFFRSSLMNMAGPVISSLAMEIVEDRDRTYMSSFVSLMNHLFRALGIFVGGILMSTFTYNTPYYFTIVCYLIGTYVLYRIFRQVDQKTT